MTATKPQERLAETTSWLVQMIANAECAGFTKEQVVEKAQQRFGKPMNELTVTEAKDLAGEYLAICRQKRAERLAKPSSPHRHRCASCSRPFHCECHFPDEQNSECSACHEGIAVQAIPTFDHSLTLKVKVY